MGRFSRLEVKGQGHSEAQCIFSAERYPPTFGVRAVKA